jgi:hypothetical protein
MDFDPEITWNFSESSRILRELQRPPSGDSNDPSGLEVVLTDLSGTASSAGVDTSSINHASV